MSNLTNIRRLIDKAADEVEPLGVETAHTYLEQIDDLSSRILKLEATLKQEAARTDVSSRMMTMPGVGPITAMAIEAFAPSLCVFRRSRDFAAWLNVLSPHKVGVFSVTPGCCADILAYAVDHCDGLVLRCYGSGTAPDTSEIRAALGRARDRKVPIIAVSQCPKGGMKLGTYAAGRVMRDNNVVDGRHTTPEMAYVKMHFCLSLHSRVLSDELGLRRGRGRTSVWL